MKAGFPQLTLLLFITGYLGLFGCGKKGDFHAQLLPVEQAQLEDIWPEFEDISPVESEVVDSEKVDQEDLNQEDLNQGNVNQEELNQESFEIPPIQHKPFPSGKTLAEMARWVVENESKKVGPACNFFIQRVMFLLGWGKSSWMANDFDKYVENKFASFRKESFRMDSTGAEKRRLKDYIWSFPERTGLVLQWKRKVGHGHIGIIQRVGNEIVLYHASLRRFSPKAQKATLDVLANRGSRTVVLNVFSDFQKESPRAPQKD